MITCIRLRAGCRSQSDRLDRVGSTHWSRKTGHRTGYGARKKFYTHIHTFLMRYLAEMKVHRGDVEQPELVGEWHATRTGILTEVASPKPAGVPLGPVYEKKSTIPAEIAFCRVCWDESQPEEL